VNEAMELAVEPEHRELAATVAGLLGRREARLAARRLLEADDEASPELWAEAADLGWLGLHVPEAHGGSGFGLEEAVVVVEQLGRACAPGPFVPTMVVGALLARAADEEVQARLLPRLVDGSAPAGIALRSRLDVVDGTASGTSVVLGGGSAVVHAIVALDDVVLVETAATAGVTVDVPPNLDPSRRSARVRLEGVPVTVLPGARRLFVDLARILLAAEAVGIARACTDEAAAYAGTREQFGRVIGTFQAVKHHCADMLVATELATAAVWDAARAAHAPEDERAFAAAVAATLSAPAADLCANLNTQVHGGIAMTWEHDAHLFMRRAATLRPLLDAKGAAEALVALSRSGVERELEVRLPPASVAVREDVRRFAESIQGAAPEEQRRRLVETGYVVPHWPAPYGRDAGAVEQLVVEQELRLAGIKRPNYGINAWVVLTLIQHATDDQIARWVPPVLDQRSSWCQLFSEPDAGSDAAAVRTRATRVDGGWTVRGQKIWTSLADRSDLGLATVRTDPDAPKHQGITMMAIDMHAPGVDVRPLRMAGGASDFNEVFLDDVFVPDDDVVGPVNGGWAVARATLGNESVSIGGGMSSTMLPAEVLLPWFDAAPDLLDGGAARLGRYIARRHGVALLNLRAAHRAVAGGSGGPESAITKLVTSELGHEAASMSIELHGDEVALLEGSAKLVGRLALFHRGMSIAGGTSEIKRNQIGERLLGLPRDPLVR
jgi:alkylation response protein AidB-like acyl-CoA dehydrogenase